MLRLMVVFVAVIGLFLGTVTTSLGCEPNVQGIPAYSWDNVHRWDSLTNYWANYYKVPADLIRRVMWFESRGYSWATSPAGAMGLMQVMPYWFYDWEDPYDPSTNIMTGAYVLRTNYKAYGSWWNAVGAYFGWGIDYWGTSTDSYRRNIFVYNNGC